MCMEVARCEYMVLVVKTEGKGTVKCVMKE